MQRTSGGLTLVLVLVAGLGLALVVAPFLVPDLPPISRGVLVGFGAILAFFGCVLAVITRLYVRTKADVAFVRTGVKGMKCVIDGGAIVIPVLHQIKMIPTNTFKLEVDRTGPEALITADFLRADVKAVFYVRVQKDPSSIIQAASSLPEITSDIGPVQALINDKLVSALRTVAAQQTLQNLNANRADFADAVQKIVAEDLKANGLSLESVTISSLDQAPLSSMRPEENVFDAQGARTIAEQVQRQRVERTRIEAEADQKVKEQQVLAAKYIAEQDAAQARAMAEAEARKKVAQSEADQYAALAQYEAEAKKNIAAAEAAQRARTVAAEQQRIAGIAEVQAQQEIELARVAQQKAIEVADKERERARRVAEVEAEKAMELARRQQEIEIARAEKARAEAAALQLAAQKQQEAAGQEVVTTREVAAAERERQKAIIAKEAVVQQQRIEQQMAADVAAYARVKEAEAEQQAAEKQAQAQLVLAEADRKARALHAEGEQALQMVPVLVAREQVKVEDDRVAVKIRELEGQARFESIARELQVELAKIEAEKAARIAAAEAFGAAMAKANVTIWGDPEAMQKMARAFFAGQSAGFMLDGFQANLPAQARELLSRLTGLDLNGSASAVAPSGPATPDANDGAAPASSEGTQGT
ncbi:MAG: SPFH domain-containing protein [Chloroherpetonaceae bacterium]|nr:SPFH domain-containing protein [Chthonomonadaceae bacterium]MDW8206256.1 SPFH domain-containing protein [Chloroherpetonaceae bacterium]